MKTAHIRKAIQQGATVAEARTPKHDAHVQAREAHVAQVREQVIASFKGAQVEVAASILSTWVVAIHGDGTPVRTHGDRLQLFSGSIWTTADKAQARAVAKNFNLQFEEKGSTTAVEVVQSGAWRKARIAQLDKFIADVSAREVL